MPTVFSSIRRSAIEVDVTQFLAFCGSRTRTPITAGEPARRAPSACSRRSTSIGAISLPTCPIADSEVFEEWASLQREHLQQRALSALERLVERAQWRGAYKEALSLCPAAGCARATARSASAHLHALVGVERRATAALAQYRQLRAMLARSWRLSLRKTPRRCSTRSVAATRQTCSRLHRHLSFPSTDTDS